MRALIVGALAAATLTAAASAHSQQTVDSTRRTTPVDGRLRAEIAVLRGLFRSVHAPTADSFEVGGVEVLSNATRQGTVAVARGDLSVRGRITGHAIALHGDVIVYPGGVVQGNAIAVDGRVRTVGGIVEGDVRSIRGLAGDILARTAGRGGTVEPVSTWAAIKMVIAWFAILFTLGIGVLLFAERNLDGVVEALQQQFARSFWTGVLAQLATIPALLLILVALAISIIGILLIPFAVVAYVVALAGLFTLGFIAVARFTGRVFFKAPAPSRAVTLRSMFVGLVIYLGLWLLAAFFVWSPVAGSVLRAVAFAGCWVALTFGLGATILTRAGTRRASDKERRPKPADEMSWQTPTPVTGVVAARRPVAVVKES
jgi:hypothetical protein